MADTTDKRTRELTEGRKVEDNDKLAKAQAMQNHLQTIQNERSNNLALEKATLGQEGQTNELLAQAGALAAMGNEGGDQMTAVVDPQTQAILGKYGINQPRVQRQQSRNVSIKPPNITINNTTNTTTTNNVSAGPLQGREVRIKQADGGNSRDLTKFKAWINNVFSQQREVSAKREREFDKRESALSRQANKMLRKMEEMGKDIAGTFNPKNIGTTIGNQLRVLLFLFGATFLATHWKKVLKGIDWVGEKVTGFLDYLGITSKGKDLIKSGGKCLRNDFIRFFLGYKADVKNTSIMDVFKTLLRDTMDYFKLKLDHAMEERGAAMKSIKFPDIDLSNPSKLLSDIIGYLGNILTAIVDPKKAIENSVGSNIKAVSTGSSALAMARKGESNSLDSYDDHTSLGDQSLFQKGENGRMKYSLTHNALDNNGNLVNTAGAQVSQGRDLLGALRDAAEYGKVDVARFSGGFRRLEDAAKKGGVTVDSEFINRMYGPDSRQLISSGAITPVQYKLVRDNKTSSEISAEGGGDNVWTGGIKAYAANKVIGGVSDWATGGGVTGYVSGVIGQAAVQDALQDKFKGQLRTNKKGFWKNAGALGENFIGSVLASGSNLVGFDAGTSLGEGLIADSTDALTNKQTLRLVPIDDPRPAVGAPKTLYRLDLNAIKALAQKLIKKNSFDYTDDPQVARALNEVLINYGGGRAEVDKRWNLKGKDVFGNIGQSDIDIDKAFSKIDEFHDLQSQHKAIQESQWNNSSLGSTEQSIRGTVNSVYQAVGSGIRKIGEGWASSTGKSTKISKPEQKRNTVYIMNDLTRRGLQPHQAAGIVGNLMSESGLNPSSKAMDTNHKMAGGLAAWNGPLWEKLHRDATAAGKPWNDIDYQLDFLWGLLNNGSKQMNDVKARLMAARTPYEASDAWAYYERYAGYNYDPRTARQAGWSSARIKQEHDKRGNWANGAMDIWREIGGQEIEKPMLTSTSTPSFNMPSSPAISRQPSFSTEYKEFSAPISISRGESLASSQLLATTTVNKIEVEKEDFGIRSEYTAGADSEKSISGFVALVGDSYAVGMAPHFKRNVEAKGGRVKATTWPGGNADRSNYYCVSGARIENIWQQLGTVCSDQPTVIVFHAGLNNWNDSEESVSKKLLNLGQTVYKNCNNPDIKIFFIAPITNQPGKFNSGNNSGNAAKVARAVRSACRAGGYGLIDLEPSSGKYKSFDNEGIHPTGSGYSDLAKDVVELLFRGGGTAVVNSVQQEEEQNQGLIDNSGFELGNSYSYSYSGISYSPESNYFTELGSKMENSQLLYQPSSEQFEKEKQISSLRAEAANLWQSAKENNITLLNSNSRAYNSVDEFMDAYTKMSDRTRTAMTNSIQGSVNSRGMYDSFDNDFIKWGLGGMSRNEFRDWYKRLTPEMRANAEQKINSMQESYANFDEWKNQFTSEELKKMAAAMGATNIHGGVDLEALRGVYKGTLNGNQNRRDTEDQRMFTNSVLYREDFSILNNQIKELREKLSEVSDPDEINKIKYNLGVLTSQRDSLGNKDIKYAAGDDLSVKGNIDKKNKEINEFNKKLAEIEYNKANFKKYFNSFSAEYKDLSDQELVELAEAMWEELCQEEKEAAEHVQKITGLSADEIEKYRAQVKEAAEIRTKHEKFVESSQAELQKEFNKLSNNGQDYLKGVQSMYEKYGQDALNMLGVSVNDLREGYARTKDLMYEKLGALQQMQDIEVDYKLGKITEEEYKLLKSKAKEKRGQEVKEQWGSWNKPLVEVENGEITTSWGKKQKESDIYGRSKAKVERNQKATSESGTSPMILQPVDQKPVWGFDTGGYTGDGPKYEKAGIVHSGELVFTPEDIEKTILNYGTGPIADTAVRSVQRGADLVEANQLLSKLSQFSDLSYRGRQVAKGKADAKDALDSGSYYNGVKAVTEAIATVGQALHSDNQVIAQAAMSGGGNSKMPDIPSNHTKVPRMTK